MKALLRLIAAIGILWCVMLGIQHTALPAHFMIDAILPASVIAKTDAGEREEILANLSRHARPGVLSWMGALSVTALSLCGLARSGQSRSNQKMVFHKQENTHSNSLTILLLLSLAFGGCVKPKPDQPNPTRQAWRDSWSALPDAKAGLPSGLKRSFKAARDQVEMPYVNGGEDAEAICENLHSILEAVGDDAFSNALLEEAPETRAAARDCMVESYVKTKHPKTHHILCDAPLITWPSDIAYQQSWAEAGQTPMPKKQWSR